MLAEQLEAVQKILNKFVELCVQYAFDAVGAIAILIAGWIVATIVTMMLKRWLSRYAIDVTVLKFVVQITKLGIYALAFIMAIAKFGFNIAPIVAGLSVVGFGTSFALQGPLSNYAAGATLIFTKPFKVGDIIEVTNVQGEVEDMSLARTMLRTVDDTVIVVPNKHIIGEVIHNYSKHRRLDFEVGIGYESDIKRAIGAVQEALRADARIVSDPAPKVGIKEFGESSINVAARAWCRQADYWDVLYTLNQRVVAAFAANKIAIPFPQRDIHIKTNLAKSLPS